MLQIDESTLHAIYTTMTPTLPKPIYEHTGYQASQYTRIKTI